ncbi:hypothetical protein ASE01_16150 [Nocardioides sp. Root190]|uniref:hypothetical protein n=1 Tax=Nocardioides sp. Root190 TaxID=1736488 RepID=UPI000701C31F|nr:hypothetical protein [Nocardioides sp. Root190]KRB76485.1 hypothetical protein ASE01_16150 [Nocardioides sp. Root190]
MVDMVDDMVNDVGSIEGPPVPVVPAPGSYESFGVHWVRRVLHKDRILRTVDQVLGDQIALGPIGAGPGRTFASVSFVGRYHPTTGTEIPGDLLAYAIDLPISVVFHLELPLDRLTFNAEVVVPLVLIVHTEDPLKLRLELQTPREDQIGLELSTDTRRGAMIRKIAGLDGELRRFLLKVLDTELSKPYVQRATHLDMEELIDHAWPMLTEQFLPKGPEDRLS